MSANSNIEWTEATWNPIAGCTPVSPGCLNCYAATMSARLDGMGQEKYRGLTVLNNGRRVFNGKISFDEKALTIPLKRKKPCTYFVNSMSDLFHEAVPFEFVDKVFAVMALCPQHTFQVLTKRPDRMAEYLDNRESWIAQEIEREQWEEGVDFDASECHLDKWPLPNVWAGTSVENQECADKRIPHLLKCPAAVRFLSCEPLLGPIDLRNICHQTEHEGYRSFGNFWDYNCENHCSWRGFESELTDDGKCPLCESDSALVQRNTDDPGIQWVIVGGESGAKSRPCNVEWVRSIVKQCATAGVACFVKQMGAALRMDFEEWQERWMQHTDKHGFTLDAPRSKSGIWRGEDRKGGNPNEWAEGLRVRQMPKVAQPGGGAS